MSRSKATTLSAPAASPAPRRTRLTLLSFTGLDAPKRLTAAQTALEAAYLKARKRKLDSSVLFVSSVGPREKTTLSLTAHYLPEQREDVSFLQREAEVLQSSLAKAA